MKIINFSGAMVANSGEDLTSQSADLIVDAVITAAESNDCHVAMSAGVAEETEETSLVKSPPWPKHSGPISPEPYDRMNPTLKILMRRLTDHGNTTHGVNAYSLSSAEARLLTVAVESSFAAHELFKAKPRRR